MSCNKPSPLGAVISPRQGRGRGSGVYTSGSRWMRPSSHLSGWLIHLSPPPQFTPGFPNHQVDCRKVPGKGGPPPPSCPEEGDPEPTRRACRERRRGSPWVGGKAPEASSPARKPSFHYHSSRIGLPRTSISCAGQWRVRPSGTSEWHRGEGETQHPSLLGDMGLTPLHHSS